ncbi:acyl-CoA synthetase [Bacillus amyloliquefaciens]|uniref:Similar to long-chain fatty-acid-CoA ligase n=1 Tax=Bacillus amyloliquefaciens (strain ATCC 23350 / DSM 7 / BCRC 11601 / CCUG 28519 / NBRC 15535 / NRRL B-14393 / F) TaxID=692420 RepID=A0A9P1NH68_BACAS|nr:acyl-CoA synthetase [Bacillus amyloliquefaciens]GLW41078.1 putative acyl--CoA ligase YhfT [Bacillus amyloliquefaciens]CBI42249.1 similar to long-chain fatty-acid-CoA ligase [Bacillus amyloliquefaciens DSM 7] [Bacillus amyloliquefaciens DSM 7 = ATCC 23350]
MITSTYSDIAGQTPDKIAIQTETEQITYQTWNRLINQTANWLGSLSVKPENIAILLPNGMPFLQLFAGAAHAGCTAIPLDPRSTAAEFADQLHISNTDVVIADRRLSGRLDGVKTPVILWDECKPLIEAEKAEGAFIKNAGLPFYTGFTSGSTGKPKAFTRSHRSWLESFACTKREFGISPKDKVLVPGTMRSSHFLYGAVSTLFIGGTVILQRKFNPAGIKDWLRQADVLYTVPTMTDALLSAEAFPDKPLKVISSGADWPAWSKQALSDRYPHLLLYDFYGTSELSFVAFLSPEDSVRKPDAAGRPFDNVKIEIRRPGGERCLPGETGKIFVNSPMKFSGYINGAKPDDSGWMTVDDMGYVDSEGYLYIEGRENGMIVSGGLNVFPEEIERVLNGCPGVRKAAVTGVPDDYWGSIAVAVIDGHANVKDLKKRCRNSWRHIKSRKNGCFQIYRKQPAERSPVPPYKSRQRT